ncbi:MAG: hypothetical protein ACXWQZ_22340, partial [Ktedonobacterales bacterium]
RGHHANHLAFFVDEPDLTCAYALVDARFPGAIIPAKISVDTETSIVAVCAVISCHTPARPAEMAGTSPVSYHDENAFDT